MESKRRFSRPLGSRNAIGWTAASLVIGVALGGLAFLSSDAEAQGKAGKGKGKGKGKSATTAAGPTQAAVTEAEKGDWSRWRGPSNDGLSAETNLLTKWPADGPTVVWKSNGFGGGMASVAVAGGKVYTMGNKEGQCHMIAASIEDGKVAWSTPLGDGGDPNCTPTIAGDEVFGVTRDSGVLVCCDAKSGEVKWKRSFKGEFNAETPGWGFSESPLVDGDLVVCGPGTKKEAMAAFDRKTGKTVWTTEIPDKVGGKGHGGAGYASPLISNAGGVKQYVTMIGKGVLSADAKTGKLLWGYNQVANNTATIPTPIVSGDFVFCSSGYGDGGTALIKIGKKGKDLAPEEVYWKQADELQNHHGGMVMLGDYVYFGNGHNNGHPVCVEWKSGKVKWGPQRGPGTGSAAMVYADGHLYFRYENGVMALVKATPEKYELVSKFDIAIKNSQSWPHPVIAGGKLYLRDQNDMIVYDIRK